MVIALAAMGAIIGDIVVRSRGHGSKAANAIVAGERQAHILTNDEAEDGDLADDMRAAGGLWAGRHRLTNSVECPGFSPAFRQGCVDEIERQRPTK